MWRGVQRSSTSNSNVVDSALGIKRDISSKVIVVIGLGYLVGHLALTLSVTSLDLWSIWSISLVIFPVIWLSLGLLKNHYHLAQLTWHVGLFAAITLAYLNFRDSRIFYLYCLIPLSLVLAENWQFGLAAEIGLIITVSLFSGVRTWPGFLAGPIQAIMLVAGSTLGVLGWALSDSLFMVSDWYLNSFSRAQEAVEENRKQRSQMAIVIKSLDQAYYRLQRTNAEMVAAWKAATEAERLRTEFATHISHELRTPLNLIVGFSEMMLVSPENYGEIPLPGSYRRDLETIYRSARHLLDLADDVIDLAKLDAGQMMIKTEKVNLAGLVLETADMVRSYIEAKGLDFQVEVDPGCPPLYLDKLRIRQVLLNLLVNATRFTEQGSIHMDVQVKGREVFIRVMDTGKGIRPEEMGYLFEEFRSPDRLQESGGSWHSGSGLGLPISKKIVELHHGQMDMKSTLNKGASIWFSLPLMSSVESDENQRLSISSPLPVYVPLAVYENSIQTTPEQNELALVLVNPDKRTYHYLQRRLDGCQIRYGADMEAGLAQAEEIGATALLVDPRDFEIQSGLPVNVVTWQLPSNRRIAMGLGAQDFLNKPVSREELFETIDRLDKPIRRVLVVDDDAGMVDLLRRMLLQRYRPADCLEASNGRDALEIIKAERPDLVLLDLTMPEFGGKEVLRHLAADASTDNPAVIVISVGEEPASELVGEISVIPKVDFPPGHIFTLLKRIFNALV